MYCSVIYFAASLTSYALIPSIFTTMDETKLSIFTAHATLESFLAHRPEPNHGNWKKTTNSYAVYRYKNDINAGEAYLALRTKALTPTPTPPTPAPPTAIAYTIPPPVVEEDEFKALPLSC